MFRIFSISLLSRSTSALSSSVPDPDADVEYGFERVDTADSLGDVTWYCLTFKVSRCLLFIASRCFEEIGGAAAKGGISEAEPPCCHGCGMVT
jgi:hypothetical protein